MSLTQMLLSAAAQLFTWDCLSVLIIGVVAGMIVGACRACLRPWRLLCWYL